MHYKETVVVKAGNSNLLGYSFRKPPEYNPWGFPGVYCCCIFDGPPGIILHPREVEAKDYFEKLAVKAANIFQNHRLDKLDPIFMKNSYPQMELMSRYVTFRLL